MIKKQGDKFLLKSKDGTKDLGTFSSMSKALERENQIKQKSAISKALKSSNKVATRRSNIDRT